VRFTWLGAVVLIGAMLIATACGGDDDPDAAATSASTSESAGGGSNDDGGGSGGDGADLGDFPVALPDWAEAVSRDDSGPLKTVLFIVPLDQVDATVAFYESWTGGQSETYLRTDSESGGVSFQSGVAVGEDKTTIAILSPLDGDDFVSVSLSYGTFE
jgi:hypothetical protein